MNVVEELKAKLENANTQIIEDYDKDIQTDNKSFEFNLQSKNNRLKKPMKFEIKDLTYGYGLYQKSNGYDLIGLGNIELMKENYKNESCCLQNEYNFNYHGIKNALCGKTRYYENYEYKGYFTPKRILVIQMN